MSRTTVIDFICPNCSSKSQATLFTSITASKNTHLKNSLLNGEINFFICNECKFRYKLEIPILYHDIDNQFAIWYAEDKTFKPDKPLLNNYLFTAKVVNDLKTLKTEILLFENQIYSTDFEQQKLVIKMDFNKYENIDDCILDFKHLYGLDDIVCKYCQHPDTMFGFSIACENCGRDINTISNKKLYIALGLLEIFHNYINIFFYPQREEIRGNIHKVMTEIKFENSARKFTSLNAFLKGMKVLGNPQSLVITFTDQWELLIVEGAEQELSKLSNDIATVIYMVAALTGYINKNVIR